MINYNSKFNSKAENIAFFISEDLNFNNNSKLPNRKNNVNKNNVNENNENSWKFSSKNFGHVN